MENTNFDEGYQTMLVEMLLSDPSSFSRCRNILQEEYFGSSIGPSVKFILEYSDQHGTVPIPELIKGITGRGFSLIADAHKHEAMLLDEVQKFCKYRAIENVILEGHDLLAKDAYGEIERRLKDAMTISLITDLGSDYFNSTKERIERLKNRSNMVSTGWNAIDKKLYGGFTRGSLNIFAGGSGSGKSLFLQNSALNWANMGLNVIYITLELSEDLVGNRIDAMVSGMSTKEIFQRSDELVFRVNDQRMKAKPGHLHLKKMAEAGTTCSDIRAYLKEYQIKLGIKPDALLIDYLDLVYPNNSRIDVTNAFAKDKYVAEEMRAIGGEWDIPVVTASQLNRQSVDAVEFDHSHIAGGISKINTADNVFGIFTSMSKREAGRYELQFLKTRSSSAVGQKVELAYDPETMRITDPLEDEDDDTASSTPQPTGPGPRAAITSTVAQQAAHPPKMQSELNSLFDKLKRT
jgi:archaellum biogenesis ATPase FlaH